MNKLNSIIVGVFILVFISGCDDPKINATTMEATKASIEKVKKSLPIEKQEEFSEALNDLTYNNINPGLFFAAALSGKPLDENKILLDLFKEIDGKTGLEVISMSKKLDEERTKISRERELSEIKELESKKLLSSQNKMELSKFKVISSSFRKEPKGEYSVREKPIIEIRVKNETKFPVSRAYFTGTIRSEGRSIPWLVEDFNYSISGGIEPNEERSWALAPNIFSEWAIVDSPSDAIFDVEVVEIDGTDGQTLFSSRVFSEDDKKRLIKLKKKHKL